MVPRLEVLFHVVLSPRAVLYGQPSTRGTVPEHPNKASPRPPAKVPKVPPHRTGATTDTAPHPRPIYPYIIYIPQTADPFAMAPPHPKRALFSLNLASESERVYQRIEDHNRDPDDGDRVRTLESSGPTAGTTQLEFVTRPFEKLVDRTVESVADGAGKKVRTVEGEIHTDVRRNEDSSAGQHGPDVVRKTSKVANRSSVSKKNKIWEKYDTSDL